MELLGNHQIPLNCAIISCSKVRTQPDYMFALYICIHLKIANATWSCATFILLRHPWEFSRLLQIVSVCKEIYNIWKSCYHFCNAISLIPFWVSRKRSVQLKFETFFLFHIFNIELAHCSFLSQMTTSVSRVIFFLFYIVNTFLH